MSYKAKLITFVLLSCASFTPLLVQANPVIPLSNTTAPTPTMVTPSAPNIDAKGFILMDANSSQVLAEKNADARMSPASLTKLMTLYLISSALKNGSIHLDDKVRISTKAWRTGGSRMFVKAGDDVSVRDLMQGIIVASGNDATVAMAEYIAGSEESFATMMNNQAKALGMNNTHFVDSTGLPNPEHYSTPRDFAKLAQAITQTFPEDYKLFSEKWFAYHGIRQPNRNRLLWRFQYADGLKTGHTDEAGYCLVSSAKKDGMRLISIVMGASSDAGRTEDSIRLLTYGFRFFTTKKVFDAEKPIADVRVWQGANKRVQLGLAHDVYMTLPANQYKTLQTKIILASALKAPITKNQAYGNLQIIVNNQPVQTLPLIALADDQSGGMWRRFSDSLSLHLHNIFSKKSETTVSAG